MKKTILLLCLAGLHATLLGAAPPAAPMVKNWTAPAYKMYGQVLADEIMARHPELLSVTLPGTPPGLSGIYTMFAGSFPDRIGKVSSPDDVAAIEKGLSIVDPKWGQDLVPPKVVVVLPLRDAAGKNIGAIVFAYDAGKHQWSEDKFSLSSVALRDGLQKRIRSYKGLFEPTNN